MRRRAVLTVLVILTGCATVPAETPEQYAERVRAYYAPQCRLAGFVEGSQAFDDCIITRWQAGRQEQDAARRAAALQYLLNTQPRTCTSVANGVSVTTACR